MHVQSLNRTYSSDLDADTNEELFAIAGPVTEVQDRQKVRLLDATVEQHW